MEEAGKIANSITNGSLEILWPTLLTVFITIVCLYFYSRIKKSGELKEINNNFKNVLEQQRKIVEQSEGIKLALAKDSIYYQIQISSYKEKSVNSINVVYRDLLALKKSAQNTSFLMNEDACKQFVESVSCFRNTFEEHRIWLPHKLANQIEDLAIEIDNRCHKYIMASKRLEAPQYRSKQQIDNLCDVQEQFSDYIHLEIREIFNNLVADITNEFGHKPNKRDGADRN